MDMKNLSNLCGYQFHTKLFPPGQTPGLDSKGAKPSSLGQSLCTKNPPAGKNRQSKAPPPGHKVRKFRKCIYKLSLICNEKLCGLN